MPDELDAAPPPSTSSFLTGLLRDWGIALVVVVVVFAAYNMFFAPKAPELGPAPDFTLNTPDGQPVSLASISSGTIVLNFWFTTCPPCRAEIPELSAWSREHPDIPLYGVATDVIPPGRLKKEAERLGVTYPVLHDDRAEVATSYGIGAFPTTLVLQDGQIVNARVGAVDRATLDAMVAGH